MVMTLTASEAGSVFYVKRPGAVLDAGSLIAHLELDDASLVTKAQDYKGQFPELEVSTPVVGEKLNHVHSSYRVMLENILSGGFSESSIMTGGRIKWAILICYVIAVFNNFSKTLSHEHSVQLRYTAPCTKKLWVLAFIVFAAFITESINRCNI